MMSLIRKGSDCSLVAFFCLIEQFVKRDSGTLGLTFLVDPESSLA